MSKSHSRRHLRPREVVGAPLLDVGLAQKVDHGRSRRDAGGSQSVHHLLEKSRIALVVLLECAAGELAEVLGVLLVGETVR